MKHAVWIGLLAALGGDCTHLPKTPEPPPLAEIAVRDVQRLDHWVAHGRAALAFKQDGYTARWRWQQRGTALVLELSGPFGQGGAKLQADPSGSVLRDPSGRRHEALNADILLTEQLGWRLPVSGLRYWLLGVPTPSADVRWGKDPAGHDYFEQQGWRIDITQTRLTQGYPLPIKLTISTDQIRARLIIEQWQLP